MNEKLFDLELTDEETANLCMGIAIGSGAGIITGAMLNNVGLLFAIGATMGVVGSVIYSYYLRYKKSIKKDLF